MIIIPLVIGAIAIVITLCYASYLDIIDRRVPFSTWVPLLLVGIPAAGFTFLSFNNGIVFLVGYSEIACATLLMAYFNNREISSMKQMPWPALIIVLQVCAGLFFLYSGMISIFLMSIAAAGIFSCATLLEFQG